MTAPESVSICRRSRRIIACTQSSSAKSALPWAVSAGRSMAIGIEGISVSAPPPKELRPALPEGPFLVVGLARSGLRGGGAAGRRGESGAGRRFRASRGGGRAFGGWASKSSWIRMDWLSSRDADGRQEPGCAPGGAGDRRGAWSGGSTSIGELELAWRAIPNRFLARDRDQRQDDDGGAARSHLPDGRRAGRGRRQRRHAALGAGRRNSSPTRRWSARPPAFSSRTASPSRPSAPSSSTSRPTTSTATRDLESYLGGEAADLRQPGQRRHRGLQRRRPGAGRG